MLPIFLGKENENPYYHVRDFEEICSTLRIRGLDDDALKLRLFPFSLKDKAKSWLYSLDSESIETYEQLTSAFFNKFFPRHKTSSIRTQICTFSQQEGESLYRYL